MTTTKNTNDAVETVDEAADKPNLAEITETLNGFDQIAIRARFHERFDQLAEDPLMLARALYFVHLRRTGEKDADAFRAAMDLPMGQLTELYDLGDEEAADPLEGDESAIAERDREYADFVLGTGLSFTVEQYMALSLNQRAKMVEAANRR